MGWSDEGPAKGYVQCTTGITPDHTQRKGGRGEGPVRLLLIGGETGRGERGEIVAAGGWNDEDYSAPWQRGSTGSRVQWAIWGCEMFDGDTKLRR